MIRGLPLLALALLLVVAFSSTKTDRADFTYVNPSGIHTLDPARMSWLQDFRVALNLWEGLTTWDPQTLEPIEGAASLPPDISADGLTYRFRIRPDSRWSNGEAVTARDFVRGWRRAMEPGTAADYQFFFTEHIAGAAQYVEWRNKAIAAIGSADAGRRDALLEEHASELDDRFSRIGIHAESNDELVIRLAKPCPYFLDLLGFPAFLPIHSSVEDLRERHRGLPLDAQGLVLYRPEWTHPGNAEAARAGLITNGPYALSEWTFKRRARLCVNRYYRNAADIRCRTVDMLEYDNVNAALMAFDAGDVDFLTDLSVPYQHELYRLMHEGVRRDIKPCRTLATYFFNFNCANAEIGGRKNPFFDSRVRRAFTLATDRASIVDNVRRLGDRQAYSFVPPQTTAGYDPPAGLRFDVPEARRLLDEAGYSSGSNLGPVELLFPPRQTGVCQALARMWEENLGVQVELRALESKTFAEEKSHQRYMIAWGNWYADYNDPTTFLECFVTGNGNNDSGYSNPKYDAIMVAAGAEPDQAGRMSALQQAERMVVEEDCPVLPVLHPTELIAVQPQVGGIYPNARMFFPFRYVSNQR